MSVLEGRSAVTHLLRVAAGLESAVVGEDEVLGQVREALAAARARGVEERAARLFETAIATGRAARAEPPPERHGLAERAVAWLSERAPLHGRPVLVVGTGVMGGALRAAASAAGGQVTMAGRRPQVAALDLAGAARMAHEMSAVAVALRGEWRELAAVPSDGRRLPPLADLSAPTAVPAAVRLSLGPDFLGIDQLWERAPAGPAWEAAADAAVARSANDYIIWLLGRDSVATLVELRERSEARRRARVERLLRRLPELDERSRRLVEEMSVQLVKDVLHEPVSALRADAEGGQGEAARRLFRL
jgi:glutamyl-tRNA reductase